MAPPKRRTGGRVTPKGTRPGDTVPSASASTATSPATTGARAGAPRPTVVASSRYTPPVPRHMKESPRWVPVLMFTLFGLGAIVILLFYLQVLPGDSKWFLVGGLGAILAGLYTATQYR